KCRRCYTHCIGRGSRSCSNRRPDVILELAERSFDAHVQPPSARIDMKGLWPYFGKAVSDILDWDAKRIPVVARRDRTHWTGRAGTRRVPEPIRPVESSDGFAQTAREVEVGVDGRAGRERVIHRRKRRTLALGIDQRSFTLV